MEKVQCPLCAIAGNEQLLYENSVIFLCETRHLKGHDLRVMAVTNRHTDEPTFEERSAAYGALIRYMGMKLKDEKWFIVGMSKHTSHPSHWHLMACDNRSNDPEELRKLHETPRVMMPIKVQTKKVLVGIPAYNEEKTIGQVVLGAKEFGYVAVVNDGSTDSTKLLAKVAGADIIDYTKNCGYGEAINDLLKFARLNNYDLLVTLDADGQHEPAEIPNFIAAIEEGADVAIGNRFLAKIEAGIPTYRKAGIVAFSKLIGFQDSQCGFRAYGRKAIETMTITEKGMGASIEILQQAREKGLRIVEVPCTVRYEEKAKRSPIRHGMGLIETLLWSTVWKNPVVYLGLPSLVLSALGLLSTVMLIDEYLRVRWFALQWAVIGVGSILGGLVFGMSAITIWAIKRGIAA